MRRAVACLALAVCAPGLLSCGKKPGGVAQQAQSVKHYLVRGKVVAVNPANQTITLAHEAVPGLMGAMTMPYKVKDASVLTELHPGDRITATLVDVDEHDFYLDSVVIIAQANPDYVPAVQYHAPAPGDEVPDFALLNQSGHTIHLRSFRGKALLITFVYTRCPLSDYCPRMSRNFAQIEASLAKDPAAYAATHLLSISFDPDYDTPAVLRSYGGAYTGKFTKETFSHWDFAAPRKADLQAVEQWFNVGVTPGDQPGQLTHSLSTLLIGPDGKVVQWYPSNDWDPAQVAAAMKRAAGKR